MNIWPSIPMYKIIVGAQADRQIKKLPPEYFKLVRQHIKELADNPRPFGAEKLTNKEGYKLRVGVYRVLYTIDDKEQVVTVYRVKHRREVYRKF
jgi:mRNA interferase RelE/StbE